jgi:hypothetical protein
MTTHSDIITRASQISENLFDFKVKGEVFIYHMKILNAVLLLRLPNFSLGVPFFPGLNELISRLSEAYLNDRRVTNVDAAIKQAKTDATNIQKAVSEILV